MGPDRVRAEKKMVNCSLAISPFFLKVCEHFVCSLILRIGLQYPFKQRNCALIPCLIEKLYFAP